MNRRWKAIRLQVSSDITAGASGGDIDRVAKAIVDLGDITVARAKEMLEDR